MPCPPRPPRRALAHLGAELESGVNWMYPWDLGIGKPLPLLNPELASIHSTRLELIEEPIREALRAAGSQAEVVDLACSEGWFAHRLLEWGEHRVVGLDIREENVRRARLLGDHMGISPDRFDVRQGDLFALDPGARDASTSSFSSGSSTTSKILSARSAGRRA